MPHEPARLAKAFGDARVVWEGIDNLRDLHNASLTVLVYPSAQQKYSRRTSMRT